MSVIICHAATAPRVTLALDGDGDMDLAAALDLHLAVLRLCPETVREIVFEVSPGAFLDCSVLHVVDGADQRWRASGGSAHFGVLGPRSERLLTLTGLQRLSVSAAPHAA